jgi:hypothetical protein
LKISIGYLTPLEFPQDNEVLEVYQNILKSGIHRVASRPQLFPYNEASHWCLRKFDTSMKNIMRKKGTRVDSLKPEDISARYHLPTPTFSLNETFLKGFTQERKGPKKTNETLVGVLALCKFCPNE